MVAVLSRRPSKLRLWELNCVFRITNRVSPRTTTFPPHAVCVRAVCSKSCYTNVNIFLPLRLRRWCYRLDIRLDVLQRRWVTSGARWRLYSVGPPSVWHLAGECPPAADMIVMLVALLKIAACVWRRISILISSGVWLLAAPWIDHLSPGQGSYPTRVFDSRLWGKWSSCLTNAALGCWGNKFPRKSCFFLSFGRKDVFECICLLPGLLKKF